MPPSIRPALSSRRGGPPPKWRASTIRCLLLATTLFALALWITVLLGIDSGGDPADVDASAPSDADAPAVSHEKHSERHRAVHSIPSPKATIAYAVSLTSCGVTSDRHDNIRNGGHSSDPSFHEGAAVLKHSIHLSSIRNYHKSGSVFDYEVSGSK